jgi:hypothetical protein
MKTYIVELKLLSYVDFTIEAETPEQAETLAWERVERGEALGYIGDWTLSDIYELPYELDQPSREG